MSPEAQQRIAKTTWGMPLWEAIAILNLKKQIIVNRRYEQTTLSLMHELRMEEIRRCNKILEEMT